jgi:antitoxin component YwqK of YwqJK toxin-antitoxin module
MSSLPLYLCLLPAFGGFADESSQENLNRIRIPENAVERTVDKFRAGQYVTVQKIYLLNDDIVGERLFFKNGNLAEEKSFRNDKLHGIWRQFHLNGKRAAERPYRDGVMDGTFRFFDEDGDLLGESLIKNGSGLLHEFQNEALTVSDRDVPFVKSEIHGTRTSWGKFHGCRGTGVEVSQYVDGKFEGWGYVRDDDGLLLGSWYFKGDRLHGVVRHVDRKGQSLEGYPKYYVNGEEVGELEYADATRGDKLLKQILEHKPPQYAKVPEAPSQAAAKRKAAEKAKAAEKTASGSGPSDRPPR